MAHTNSTTNYELPQFIGTDKPAWLSDFNGAMNTIDVVMKTNANNISTNASNITSVTNNVGTLNSLETTTKTDVVSAINEIVENIDVLEDFSATEQKIGLWVDGKPLYRKVVDIGTLPNSAQKSVVHNIANLDHVAMIMGIAKNPTTMKFINLPYTDNTNLNWSVELVVGNVDIDIVTHDNKTAYTDCFVVLEYTKTTDTI